MGAGTRGRSRTTLAFALVLVLLTAADAGASGTVRESPRGVVRFAFERGTFLGRSVKGRPITMRSFGHGARRVLVVGGIHGDEYGAGVARAFSTALRADPASVPSGSRIDVVACLNPDGDAVGTRSNARRVDLNRNLPSRDWASRLDARDPASAEGCTGGTGPGSEPETQALLRVLEHGYDAVVMLHSAGGMIDHDGPGGEALARRMSSACALPVRHLGYQPYVHGSVGQYVPERYGVPVVTVELRDRSLSDGLRRALLEAARW